VNDEKASGGLDGVARGGGLGPQAFEAYMTEYQQCYESYRHTYATIWQAGSIFVAASAAILGIAASGEGGIDPLVQVIAPLPFLFWWLGVFRPMNRYGELRSERLAGLELTLNAAVPGLRMSHSQTYDRARKSEGFLSRLVRFKWLWRPRVSEFVNLVGVLLALTEIALLWIHYL
jgi:hypothetical protein